MPARRVELADEAAADRPSRLLCGPGPSNVALSVVRAQAWPLLGHLDPDFIAIADEVVAMLRQVYRREHGLVIPLSTTGTGGMEAGVAALVEPGDTVIVGVAGYFGARIAEICRRHGAHVVEVEAAAGQHVPVDRLAETLRRHPAARALFVVHAETSTGVWQPVAELGAVCADSETLLAVDCVTSLGGVEVEAEAWHVDYGYSCTQKCLAAPPGLAPIAVSERAMARVRARRSSSFVFDLELLERYWVGRPASYHHTAPVASVYALHEALRLVLEEGLEARLLRHADAGAYLQRGLRERGLEILADEAHSLPQLTAVLVPEGIDGDAVRKQLLRDYGIEIGGALAGGAPVWRIGLMGENATRETAKRVLVAVDAVLACS